MEFLGGLSGFFGGLIGWCLLARETNTAGMFKASTSDNQPKRTGDGEHQFTSEQAMVAIGSGVGSIMPWKADMTCYLAADGASCVTRSFSPGVVRHPQDRYTRL